MFLDMFRDVDVFLVILVFPGLGRGETGPRATTLCDGSRLGGV